MVHGCYLIIQFAIGKMVFLLNKRMPTTSVVVSRVPRDLFHGKEIVDGVYKVEVRVLMFPGAPLPFPNHNNSLAQLLFEQVCGQFNLWESAMMWKAN
jgi:hypothetical protein